MPADGRSRSPPGGSGSGNGLSTPDAPGTALSPHSMAMIAAIQGPLQVQMAGIGAQVTTIGTRIAAVEHSVQKVSTRMTAMEARMTAVENGSRPGSTMSDAGTGAAPRSTLPSTAQLGPSSARTLLILGGFDEAVPPGGEHTEL